MENAKKFTASYNGLHQRWLDSDVGKCYLSIYSSDYWIRFGIMVKNKKKSLWSAVLVAATLLLASTEYPSTTLAGTCTPPNCPPRPIQFTPGQSIRVEVVNATSSLVQLQKLYGTDPVPLRPGQEFVLNQGDGTIANISLVFWDATGLPLKTRVSKPNDRTLRVEIRPGGRPPGDRSLYILNDGHVKVF